MAVGIMGFGVYVPRFRVERKTIGNAWGLGGRGEIAINSLDEDVITMAVEAAQNALQVGNKKGETLDGVYLGTTSGPYTEGPGATVIKTALGASHETETFDFGSSTRAGTAALKGAIDSLQSGRLASCLVLAADKRQGWPGSNQELNFGAAAGALLLGTQDVLAEIEASYSYTSSFLDRWKSESQEYIEDYDPKFTRHYGYEKHLEAAVRGLLKRSGKEIAAYDYVVLQGTDPRSMKAVAQKLGIKPEQSIMEDIFNKVGDTGNSSVFLGLARALAEAKAGQRLLVCSYGSGASDAFSLVVKKELGSQEDAMSFSDYLASKKVIAYVEYLKKRQLLQQQDVGAKTAVSPASPLLWRDSEAILQHLGARCKQCGYVNYPPSQRIMCIRCGYTELESVSISKKGTVHTFSINYRLPAPLESPLPIIVADLADGVRHRALGTEMEPNDLKIDTAVEMVLRIITEEKGSRLYGYKYRLPRWPIGRCTQ